MLIYHKFNDLILRLDIGFQSSENCKIEEALEFPKINFKLRLT